MKTNLFQPIKFREVEVANRIFMSPMCQYSATDGVANSWHQVHLGTRAVAKTGLIIVEATGVEPRGRITPGCLGLWNDQQVQALRPIVEFIKQQGSVAAIQLAHAGRKASSNLPWRGGASLPESEGGWQTVAPSAIPFGPGWHMPTELNEAGIEQIKQAFVAATERALQAGFQVVELHMAHGYLLHEFLSPLTNKRQDQYGGSLQNRMRLPLTVAAAVRAKWPAHLPLFVRLSATDWVDGGWDLAQSIQLCHELKKLGVDFIDCSTGGLVPDAKIPVGPHFQVPFAQAIRREVQMPVGAVGMIADPAQANQILADEKADAILLARELLRNPYWVLQSAKVLSNSSDKDVAEAAKALAWPPQYVRSR